MNPIELYKKLPRTNCGVCRQKACMPFAFALLKGEAELSECCQLSGDAMNEVAASIRKSDWREDLISGLREEVKKIRLAEVAENLGAVFRDGRLILTCFSRRVTIGSDGTIEAERALTPWMRILLLLYIKNGGSKGLSGTWVFHNELRGGMMKGTAFRRECEEPLRELFDNHFLRASQLLDEYGAEHPKDFATPDAWLVYVFPRLPVLFLYWPTEDEFESKVTIRFDSTADDCFDVEQLIFLVEELLRDIEASL